MNKKKGYFRITTIGGSPIFVHWSFPAGGILISVYGHLDPRQWVYYCIAYTLLILIHEGGHFVAARLFRLKVFALEITGLGGRCRIERPRNIRQGALFFSAGLITQFVTFLLVLSYVQLFGTPKGAFAGAIVITFTLVNLIIFVINLIPATGRGGRYSDGKMLWRLLLHVWKGQPHPLPPLVITPIDQTPVFPPDTRLITRPGFRPPGFIQGIEMLNDKSTPMEFVVDLLMRHLALSQAEAAVKTLDMHNTGGMLIPLPTAETAHRIADAIAAEAQAAGHSFVCRYASTK